MLLKASVRTIAIYRLLSAAAFAYVMAWNLLSGQILLLNLAVYTVLLLFNLFAGVESLRSKRRGYWASLVNELLQLPSLAVRGFAYEYIGLGQVQVMVGGVFNPSGDLLYQVGFQADFNPGFFVLLFGGAWVGANIAIDLLSTIFAVFLANVLSGSSLPSASHGAKIAN